VGNTYLLRPRTPRVAPEKEGYKMCFFDQQIYQCGDFKWGPFRQHCAKEYRIGETCGMKLVMQNIHVQTKCRMCEKIERKWQRRAAELDRIRRWQQEPQGGRKNLASIKKSHNIIQSLNADIKKATCMRVRMLDLTVLRSVTLEMEEIDKFLEKVEKEYASTATPLPQHVQNAPR
jgi:hypothetical protein